eukprot:TRINITY_DN2208_c0_g3_i1.p1 TRINITY_DN2208_c0_g3~~TRINITY_DN2208_c0_g3_i1.p1  ORF type:complete len:1043 (-),score=120.79 TRINITY_DN2208_c0_g3_i1:333-3461(-)
MVRWCFRCMSSPKCSMHSLAAVAALAICLFAGLVDAQCGTMSEAETFAMYTECCTRSPKEMVHQVSCDCAGTSSGNSQSYIDYTCDQVMQYFEQRTPPNATSTTDPLSTAEPTDSPTSSPPYVPPTTQSPSSPAPSNFPSDWLAGVELDLTIDGECTFLRGISDSEGSLDMLQEERLIGLYKLCEDCSWTPDYPTYRIFIRKGGLPAMQYMYIHYRWGACSSTSSSEWVVTEDPPNDPSNCGEEKDAYIAKYPSINPTTPPIGRKLWESQCFSATGPAGKLTITLRPAQRVDQLEAKMGWCPIGQAGNFMIGCQPCVGDTYSDFDFQDGSVYQKLCRLCPDGSSTTSISGRVSSHNSICDCHCAKGSYLNAASWCDIYKPEYLHELYQGEAFGGDSIITLSDGRSVLPRTTIASVRDQMRCLPCGKFKTTNTSGSQSEKDCRCDIFGVPGLIEVGDQCGCADGSFFDSELRKCRPCASQGERCSWGADLSRSMEPPDLEPGFWSEFASSQARNASRFGGHSIYRCYSSEVCTGSNGTCAHGRHGRACSLCVPGLFGSPDGPCEPCHNSPSGALASLLAMTILLSLAGTVTAHYVLNRQEENFEMAKNFDSLRLSLTQLFSYVQTLGVVSLFDVEWPAEIKEIFSLLRKFGLDFTIFARPACLIQLGQSASLELAVSWLVPVGAVLVAFAAPALLRPLAWLQRRVFPTAVCMAPVLNMTLDQSAKVVCFMIKLFFPTLMFNGFRLFTCIRSPNGHMTVASFPHLECPGEHSAASDEWLLLLPCAVLFLLAFGLGMFLICSWALNSVLRHMAASNLQKRGRWSFLFRDFRNAHVHWPLLILMKDLCINIIAVAFSGHASSQLLLTAIVMLAFCVATLTSFPFTDMSNSFMEMWLAFATFITCIFTAGMGFPFELLDASSESSNFLLAIQGFSFFVPACVVAYQIALSFNCSARLVPAALRPWQQDDMVEAINNWNSKLHIADTSNLAQIMSRFDSVELSQILSLIQNSPATLGLVEDSGASHLTIRRNLSNKRIRGSNASAADV